jgi:Conjugal transfer protein TraD
MTCGLAMLENSSDSLIRQKQYVARNVLSLNRERKQLRKADTRRKIQLGGLMIKAELREESSSVLLGLLRDAKISLIMKETDSVNWEMKNFLGHKVSNFFESTNL